MSPELQQAVKERIELGHSREQITAELHEAGYDDITIDAVYSASVSPIPIPGAVELPSATTLFSQAWKFTLSRPDLLALLTLPTLLINGAGVAMQMNWLPVGVLSLAALLIGFLGLVFVQFLLQLTLAHTVITTQKSSPVTLAESWNWATKNVWPWLWIATLSFCVVFGGFMLLIIPGVIVSFYIAFAVYVYIDEDVRGMSALQRSRELVTGNFWDVLSRLFVFILFIIGLSLLAGLIALILVFVFGAVGNTLDEIVIPVFDAFMSAFISMLGIYFAAGLYNALKQKTAQSVTPSPVYPALGWFGALAMVMFLGLATIGAVAYVNEVGLENFDWEELMNSSELNETNDASAELTPAEQAEFDAFMEMFGEELESF